MNTRPLIPPNKVHKMATDYSRRRAKNVPYEEWYEPTISGTIRRINNGKHV